MKKILLRNHPRELSKNEALNEQLRHTSKLERERQEAAFEDEQEGRMEKEAAEYQDEEFEEAPEEDYCDPEEEAEEVCCDEAPDITDSEAKHAIVVYLTDNEYETLAHGCDVFSKSADQILKSSQQKINPSQNARSILLNLLASMVSYPCYGLKKGLVSEINRLPMPCADSSRTAKQVIDLYQIYRNAFSQLKEYEKEYDVTLKQEEDEAEDEPTNGEQSL